MKHQKIKWNSFKYKAKYKDECLLKNKQGSFKGMQIF